MAFDSYDYPGSPWKRPPADGSRGGMAIDLTNAVWVPGPMAKDSAAVQTARRVALFRASFPGNAHLK